MRLRRKGREKVPLGVDNDNMTLAQHLGELRMRLIRCLLAVVLFGVLIFVLYDPWIQDFLFRPYREVCDANPDFGCNGEPVLITPLGGFNTRMKVAGWGGSSSPSPWCCGSSGASSSPVWSRRRRSTPGRSS